MQKPRKRWKWSINPSRLSWKFKFQRWRSKSRNWRWRLDLFWKKMKSPQTENITFWERSWLSKQKITMLKFYGGKEEMNERFQWINNISEWVSFDSVLLWTSLSRESSAESIKPGTVIHGFELYFYISFKLDILDCCPKNYHYFIDFHVCVSVLRTLVLYSSSR